MISVKPNNGLVALEYHVPDVKRLLTVGKLMSYSGSFVESCGNFGSG
jgi:hypothetical protein